MLFSCIWRALAPASVGLGSFSDDRRGVTSLEYALIAFIVAIAMLGGVGIIGGQLSTIFNQVSSEL